MQDDHRPKPSMVPNAFGNPDPRIEPCPERSTPCDEGPDDLANALANDETCDDLGDDVTDDQRGPSPLDVIAHPPDWRVRSTPQKPRRHLPRSDEFSAGGLAIRYFDARPSAAIIGRIDRRGRLLWSLPKGHIEAGETAADAAVREVQEETGIVGTVVAPLGIIDYWFVADGRRVHKTVTHFLMEAIGGELSDEDPEVVAVAWVPLDDLPRRLAYADERRIAVDAIRLMADSA